MAIIFSSMLQAHPCLSLKFLPHFACWCRAGKDLPHLWVHKSPQSLNYHLLQLDEVSGFKMNNVLALGTGQDQAVVRRMNASSQLIVGHSGGLMHSYMLPLPVRPCSDTRFLNEMIQLWGGSHADCRRL